MWLDDAGCLLYLFRPRYVRGSSIAYTAFMHHSFALRTQSFPLGCAVWDTYTVTARVQLSAVACTCTETEHAVGGERTYRPDQYQYRRIQTKRTPNIMRYLGASATSDHR